MKFYQRSYCLSCKNNELVYKSNNLKEESKLKTPIKNQESDVYVNIPQTTENFKIEATEGNTEEETEKQWIHLFIYSILINLN